MSTENRSHSKLTEGGIFLIKSQSSFIKDRRNITSGDNSFSISSLNRCVGATGPAIIGRPLRSAGTGMCTYSEQVVLHISIIVLLLCTFGVTYMLLDFHFLLLIYVISCS